MPGSGSASGSAFNARSEPPGRSGASHSSPASDSAMSAMSAPPATARRLRTPELPPWAARFHFHAHVELRVAAELRLQLADRPHFGLAVPPELRRQLVDRLLAFCRIGVLEADQLAAAFAGDRAAGAHLGERELALAPALRAGDLHVHAKRTAQIGGRCAERQRQLSPSSS